MVIFDMGEGPRGDNLRPSQLSEVLHFLRSLARGRTFERLRRMIIVSTPYLWTTKLRSDKIRYSSDREPPMRSWPSTLGSFYPRQILRNCTRSYGGSPRTESSRAQPPDSSTCIHCVTVSVPSSYDNYVLYCFLRSCKDTIRPRFVIQSAYPCPSSNRHVSAAT